MKCEIMAAEIKWRRKKMKFGCKKMNGYVFFFLFQTCKHLCSADTESVKKQQQQQQHLNKMWRETCDKATPLRNIYIYV